MNNILLLASVLVMIGGVTFVVTSLFWLRYRWSLILEKRIQRRDSYGYIYVVRGKGELPFWYKIGRTNDLERRFKEHRTSISPRGIVVVSAFVVRDDRKAESRLFEEFSNYRMEDKSRKGRDPEWFRVTPRMWIIFRMLNDSRLVEDFDAKPY